MPMEYYEEVQEDSNWKHKYPPGFRFDPTDQELMEGYLFPMLFNQPVSEGIIAEVDVYKYEPVDLVEKAFDHNGEKETLFFFSPRQKRSDKGKRPNRRTTGPDNFWRMSHSSSVLNKNGILLGTKNTLVYYINKNQKTNWIMHEYVINESIRHKNGQPMDDMVLCKIYNRGKEKSDDEVGKSSIFMGSTFEESTPSNWERNKGFLESLLKFLV